MTKREKIMTKKDKFRRIASALFDIVGVENYFYHRCEALKHSLTEEEKAIEKQLWRVYMDGLKPRHENNKEYDRYIQMALTFVKTVVGKYVPEEEMKHANGYEFTFEFLERDLDCKEVENWKAGSKFICVLNENVSVKRIPLKTDDNGNWKNHLYGAIYESDLIDENFKPEFANMDGGLYEVVETGERFDIRDAWGKTLEIDSDKKKSHTIIKAFEYEKEFVADEMEDFGLGYGEVSECSRCRGGGCPQCDTTGFFTGFPIHS
ncbi:hypothetical protein [Bacillus thuringiensis]|uniref:hypothetical protein n=1 Tax=Bacillus thuringiensis TaxID=1428 RepID=UPI0021D6913E|nr:hypothetical protein [Bacillus thuringiensis]MCU7667331.1 hypothetical protein [Bacillus thuringiensis]